MAKVAIYCNPQWVFFDCVAFYQCELLRDFPLLYKSVSWWSCWFFGRTRCVCVYMNASVCVWLYSIIFSGRGGVGSGSGRGRGEGCWLLPFFFVPYPCCLLLSPYQCLCGFTYCTIFLWTLFFMCNSHRSHHANKGKCVSKKCTGYP